ncbi:Linoleate 13S-lipoxygenase 2-1, chloroplastic [Morella rubra]|uniref:Linoleate 13S-lipoxygenase 2-1, chloroplastic n=1 Tax=Morella rubra TaxID=262757 RepID=A0A6A1WHM4_9ROSI|nr:Linoleate 13S-lipoxygenase 2-1, chloroplastic [Morella rubra]
MVDSRLTQSLTSSPSVSEKSVLVLTALLTVKATGGFFANLGLTRPLDDLTDLLGKTFLLELVSAELDPNTGLERETIKSFAHKVSSKDDEVRYESEFVVSASFGQIGAVLLENKHHKEVYLMNIVLDGFPSGPVHFTCNSWVHSKYDNPEKRIFFTHESYLPSKTPSGLTRLRKIELENLRGNGKGERKSFERIYDYDTYNDLGDPDKSTDMRGLSLEAKIIHTQGDAEQDARTLKRNYRRKGLHILLSAYLSLYKVKNTPDPLSEQRSSSVYVPRDEAFSEVKQVTFSTSTLKNVLHALLPQLEIAMLDPNLGFPFFTAIDSLFDEGVALPQTKSKGLLQSIVPRLVKAIVDSKEDLLRFETPEMIDRDKFAWFRDEEFSRQTLAGLNPFSIQLVTEWPLKSKLDPEIYGSPESLITTELVEREIRGITTVEEAQNIHIQGAAEHDARIVKKEWTLKSKLDPEIYGSPESLITTELVEREIRSIMTVEEALQSKRFLLDYHDLLLPYVNKVRETDGTTLYGSRTLFFLTEDGTLKLLAIEITRPPSADKPQWKQVFPRVLMPLASGCGG